jgi:adenosylhomocysteine nucleosidase
VRTVIAKLFDHFGDLPKIPASTGAFDDTFRAVFGPIGCGEAVVKYREAEERKWLQSVHDKVLVVETEAAGASQQFDEDELRRDVQTRGLIVIRGVSDHADQEKDDAWRIPAVLNAMRCLEAITSLHEVGLLHDTN